MDSQPTKQPLNEWRAASVRITAFPFPDFDLVSRDLWSELGLGEADSSVRKKGQISHSGPVKDHYLGITYAAGRIDWVYRPKPEKEEEFDEVEFRDVGPFTSAVQSSTSLVREWLENKAPDLKRLALGITLRLKVNNRVEGYRQLNAYLRAFDLDGDRCTDFHYQINRFRQSAVVAGLRVNRLSQWSVAILSGLVSEIQFGAGNAWNKMQEIGLRQACQLVLDINSAADYHEKLKPAEISQLLDEFVQLAAEIVEQGDVP